MLNNLIHHVCGRLVSISNDYYELGGGKRKDIIKLPV